MYCTRCGKAMDEQAAFCPNCGEPAVPSAAPASGVVPPSTTQVGPLAVTYAGFWLRLVAYIIDALILSAAWLIVMIPLVPVVFRGREPYGPQAGLIIASSFLWICFLGLVGGWLYYALFQSSSWQATPGKRVLGLYVCDMQGRRISFARATARYFSKILSAAILYIGFIMAGFTEKKQALHDMITDCLVLRRV